MFIDAIELYRVRMPLVYPFRTAFGNYDAIESVLVKLVSGEHVGWGETAPWQEPTYSPEWTGGVFALLRDHLAPRLLRQDISSGEHLQALLAFVKGNPFAKAALDLAWWDLYARWEGKPLWQLLGGRFDEVAVGADFGVMENIDALIRVIDEAVAAGYERIKLKYRPGWDLDMVDAVRKTFPDTVFHIDCNSAYGLQDADMFKALDAYKLAMIEQPLAYDDLYDHSLLQQMLQTPICLDESITSPAKARQALEMNACGWVNIKPGRVGGITPSLMIHDVCREGGVPVWIGGMLESAVGAAFCIALATLPNVSYPSDIFPSYRFYQQDLADPAIELCGPGRVRASGGSGVGCEPVPERLAARQIEMARLE